MRPYLLAAALLVPAAIAPAHAGLAECAATAETPTWQHNFGATAAGSFGCDSPRSSLSVEVCLEVLDVAKWIPIACDTATATDATQVASTAYGCEFGLTLIRSHARGSASTGETGDAVSVPTAYYCTPL